MQDLRYDALERIRVPRPVDRLDFIQALARGKKVFDLGALDETAFELKRDTDRWLHARLCASASSVTGIDNSSLVPAEGLATLHGGRIVNADIFDLSGVVERFGKPDLVVAGELLEHLPSTESFLSSLRQSDFLKGAEFVFSTPNACSWHNVLVGLAARESMHQDHLQIYSYKTLRTLFERSGIELQALVPYHVRFDEMISKAGGIRRLGVSGFQKIVNAMEFMTPLLSAGWVGIARL